MKVFVAIDVLKEKVVRLEQGDFNKVTDYEKKPEQTFREMATAGIRNFHVVSLDGALDGTTTPPVIPDDLKESPGCIFQTGGGVRSKNDYFDRITAGYQHIVIGSWLSENISAVTDLIKTESSSITAGIDVLRGTDGCYTPKIFGWQQEWKVSSLDALLLDLQNRGIKRLVCTDISRDGCLGGPDFNFYSSLRRLLPTMDIVASGGVHALSDLRRLESTGVNAVITGKAVYEKKIRPEDLLPWQ